MPCSYVFTFLRNLPNILYPSSRKDLQKLSQLGHFLKGSSAALGVAKVQASCEKIQHYGKLWDHELEVNLEEDEALSRIEKLVEEVKQAHIEAKKWFVDWYKEHNIELGEDSGDVD